MGMLSSDCACIHFGRRNSVSFWIRYFFNSLLFSFCSFFGMNCGACCISRLCFSFYFGACNGICHTIRRRIIGWSSTGRYFCLAISFLLFKRSSSTLVTPIIFLTRTCVFLILCFFAPGRWRCFGCWGLWWRVFFWFTCGHGFVIYWREYGRSYSRAFSFFGQST